MIRRGSLVRCPSKEFLGAGIVERVLSSVPVPAGGQRYIVKYKDQRLKQFEYELEEVVEKQTAITPIQFDTAYMQASIQYFGDCDLPDDTLTNHVQSIGAVVGLMRQILFNPEEDERDDY